MSSTIEKFGKGIWYHADNFAHKASVFGNQLGDYLIKVPGIFNKDCTGLFYEFKGSLALLNIKIGVFNLVTTFVIMNVALTIFTGFATLSCGSARNILSLLIIRHILGHMIDAFGITQDGSEKERKGAWGTIIQFKDTFVNSVKKTTIEITTNFGSWAFDDDVTLGGDTTLVFFRKFSSLNLLARVYQVEIEKLAAKAQTHN